MISWRRTRRRRAPPSSAGRRRVRRPWRTGLAIAALGCVLGAAVAAPHAGAALVVSSPIADPDAIVSLASREWERLPEAARLASEYTDARVLLTVPRRVTTHNCHDCENRVARLSRLGVAPERVIVLPFPTEGTYDEALACLEIARRDRLRALLVVTSPYHTRRALAAFRRAFAGTGILVGVQPASAFSEADPPRWWLAPYDRWYVRYEWLALAYYGLRYRVDPFVRPAPGVASPAR